MLPEDLGDKGTIYVQMRVGPVEEMVGVEGDSVESDQIFECSAGCVLALVTVDELYLLFCQYVLRVVSLLYCVVRADGVEEEGVLVYVVEEGCYSRADSAAE